MGWKRIIMSIEMHEDTELEESPVLEEVLGEALKPLRVFHKKLATEGEERGLIGPRDVNILWERHILNSAAVVPFIREALDFAHSRSIADLGSGGGFPGLIIAACLPDQEVTLIEPMERRVVWLDECVEAMGLNNVSVVRARSEEVISRIKHHASMRPFGVVTCRAVAPMTKLAGWTLPMLQHGGRLVALKGRSAEAEITKASKEINKQGGVNPRVYQAPVAEGFAPTAVVLVDKR
jgi:16S rRNA (guanine527-N7)-methyltransferase